MIKKTYNFDEKYIQDPPPPKKKNQGGVFICSSISRNKNINIVGGGEGNGVQKIAVIVYKTIKTRICTEKTLFKYK